MIECSKCKYTGATLQTTRTPAANSNNDQTAMTNHPQYVIRVGKEDNPQFLCDPDGYQAGAHSNPARLELGTRCEAWRFLTFERAVDAVQAIRKKPGCETWMFALEEVAC